LAVVSPSASRGLGGALAAAAADHERREGEQEAGASHRRERMQPRCLAVVPGQAEGPAASRGPLEIRLMLR